MKKTFHISQVDSPTSDDLKKVLEYFCSSLGLANGDNKKMKVFILLWFSTRYGKGINANDLAKDAKLSLTSIKKHLSQLSDLGLITLKNNKWVLISNTLFGINDYYVNNCVEILRKMRTIAIQLDRRATRNNLKALITKL